MGLKDTASLALIPAAYKTSKIYSAIPTDGDGDFTFTRSGNATRINKAGLVETMGTNIGRLNYDLTNGTPASCPSLLLERTRTNQILYSEDFTNAVWQKISGGTGVAPVVTANYSVAPDGSNTADRVVLDMGSNTSINDYSIIRNFGTSGSTGTNSVYIKSNTSDSYTLGIDNTGQQETITVTPQWQRFSYSVTNSDRLQISLRGGGQTVSAYADVSMWGGSLENGTYVTSYIPTTTAAVTKTQDDFENSFTGLTSTAATIFLDFETQALDFNFGRLFAVHDSVTSDGIYLGIYSTNTIAFFGINSGAGLPGVKDTISFNERNKIALTFDGAGNYKYSLNGSIQTGTYVGTSRQYDEVGRGNVIGGSSNNIQIHQFMLFNEALSDSELQALTT